MIVRINSSEYKDLDGRWKVAIFSKGAARGIHDVEESRDLFLSSATEYEAAMQFVSSWEHWKHICMSPINKKTLDLWREEKLLQDQTKARKMLWEAAEKGNLTAARVIYEAKKEQQQQKKGKKIQSEQELREEELLKTSTAKIVSLKAQR